MSWQRTNCDALYYSSPLVNLVTECHGFHDNELTQMNELIDRFIKLLID